MITMKDLKTQSERKIIQNRVNLFNATINKMRAVCSQNEIHTISMDYYSGLIRNLCKDLHYDRNVVRQLVLEASLSDSRGDSASNSRDGTGQGHQVSY